MKFLREIKISLFQLILIFVAVSTIAVLSFFSFAENPAPAVITNLVKKDSVTIPVNIIKPDTSPLHQLLFTIDTLARSPGLAYGSFGFSLVSIDSNKIITEYNSHISLVPASVMKTLSTGIALAKLGADYKYETCLQYDGEIDPATKILHGNIYIQGSGDPSLGSDAFGNTGIKTIVGAWTSAIKNWGIDSIDGAVIGDAQYFDNDLIPGGWAWEDMQSSYGAGASGLAFRENTYDVDVKCKGKFVYASTYPPVPGIILHNQVLYNVSIPKNYLFVAGAPYQNERFLLGEVKSNYTERSNIPDPALCCAYNLFLQLKANNIGIKDSCTTVFKLKLNGDYYKKERKKIHSTLSPPLTKLVNLTNKTSQNFYAETLLKTLGAQEKGFGTIAGGIKEVISYLKEKNIDLRGFYMADGSGLSRLNSVTPKFLTDLLVAYANDPSMFQPFYNSLSVAGESGTMEHVAQESIAVGNIHAKSGSMGRVQSYAGYVTTRSGRMLAFSVILNNQGWDYMQTRKKLETLMVLMASLD
ncbi:MAG TPA: D-alanyl-D-alanine carboxypeptidase/D-alanyl-D-alanine-endopeptidase [Cytophagaceae bacterium]|nr:D-alanyl-D-alanine carboxypeptidase/D-alanyl-D-alanine-endopeptidase [Cytophagaceae bacterium]